MNNIIKFVSNSYTLNKNSATNPEPTIKHLPDWYRKAERYHKLPSGEPYRQQDGSLMLTWKSCPAIFDVLITGYVLRLPCDIEFYLNDENKISVKVHDQNLQHFCTERPPMPGFAAPMGYYEDHFAWYPDWATIIPEGYTALYTHPMNRYDLPFTMPFGIIDNDKVNLPGLMPFYIAKGFQGIIKAGTPYMQILPFKKENWESKIEFEIPEKIYQKNMDNSKKYRTPEGGVYKNEIWQRREYK